MSTTPKKPLQAISSVVTSAPGPQSFIEARQTLLNFFGMGRAARSDQAVLYNVNPGHPGHGRQLWAALRELIGEGIVIESRKRLASGKPSPKFLYHLKPDLLAPDALARLQTLVVLSARAVRP